MIAPRRWLSLGLLAWGLGAASPVLAGMPTPACSVAADAPAETPTPAAEATKEPPAVPPGIFRPDPAYEKERYDPKQQEDIYGAKHLNPTQRPLIEWGRELYQYGPFRKSPTGMGSRNPMQPSFWLYGDWRTAVAFNDNGGGKALGQLATRLNLDADLRLTSTERFHAFFRPLDKNGEFTNIDFNDARRNKLALNGNQAALFFEGDVGAMAEGFSGRPNHLDLPFAAGLMPLLFQNGVWMEDAFQGVAFTIPAKNSPRLDISNVDTTFFVGYDNVSTPAIPGDHNARAYGVTSFIDASEGYWELGYAYVDDRSFRRLGYHNLGLAFSKRYGDVLSNSVRLIGNVGQHPAPGFGKTADGLMVLVENSFITDKPWTFLPYVNAWAGFNRPQSVARDPGAGGILKNTGILFETDGLTGYPTLDATGNNTYGVAVGVQDLFDFDRQLVVEGAVLKTMGPAAGRAAPGDQYGLGLRYQQPISNSIIVRFDTMVAIREHVRNLFGARIELRTKY